MMHAGMLESWARQCAASEQVCLLLEPSAAAVCGGLRVCERGGGSTALREAASHPEVHAGLLLGQASQSAPQPGCCWARRLSMTLLKMPSGVARREKPLLLPNQFP